MSRRGSTIATYLACFAMALQALWPLIAQAKPRAVTLVPICTVQGVTHYLELPAGNSPLEQKSSSHHEHCAYCSFGAERVALPTGLESFVSPQFSCATPVHVEALESETQQYLCANPRAPPAIP